MMIHPQFDPVALQIGPVALRWYGLMYLIAFAAFYALGRLRLKPGAPGQASGLVPGELEDLLFYGALGVVLGGRLGYILFYKPLYYVGHPLEALAVWQGGMSFHGGMIGVIVAVWLWCRRRGHAFLPVIDFVAPLVPLGLAAGRLGNFINGELWGRATEVPWAMVFPQAGDLLPRHPSQLYQFAGEGVVLFVILWGYSARLRGRGAVSGVFLIGYSLLRFAAEFAREPDAFLGTLALGLSMGQWLCVPMFLLGLWLLVQARSKGQSVG